MNKQALVVIFTCLYILGIIAFALNLIPLFSFILICLSIYFLFFNLKIKQKYIFIFLTAYIIGIVNTGLNIQYDNELVPFSDNDVTINARVLTIPTNNIKDRTKFYALVKDLQYENKEIKSEKSKIFITINDLTEKIEGIKIGDTLMLKGRLKTPMYSQNPSQFDYARYLQYKKTFSLLYVDTDWEITSNANYFTGKVLSKLNDTRDKILKIHAQNIKSPMLEILGGIIFGDDAVNPDEETKELFINSGIFHILAASGMNVTLIFGIWFFTATRLRLNYKFSIITGILLILFYTFMTGFGPPIIRAALMLTLILIGKLIDKETSTISLLFFVGGLMLIYNPLMLFDIGFQLSFIVTFALILTTPLIVFKFKYKWLNNTIGACFIPIIAQFYAAPLQMFYFNTFTLYSVFANIVIIPMLSIVSFVGFLGSILALIPAIAYRICFLTDLILNPPLFYIVKIAEFFSNLPHSIVFIQKPMLIQMFLYYFFIILFTCVIRYKLVNRKIIIILTAVITLFLFTFIKLPDKNMEILCFSVGNADSFLVKSPDNRYFMIDTGKNGYKTSSSPAKNIMIKYMRDKGIKDIQGLILSHFDADHAGGTVDILNDLNVKTVYITDVYENTTISDSIQNYVKEHSINEKIIINSTEIYNKNNFKVTLLKPKSDLIKSENQKSLIAHFKYKNQNFLFMGDGDINTYNALPEEFKKNIRIMKSGHHGAKNTVNNEMAKNSDIFILSTGSNIYNHPNGETLKIITENNKSYLRTDYNNAIKIIIKPEKMVIYQYSPRKKRFEKINNIIPS